MKLVTSVVSGVLTTCLVSIVGASIGMSIEQDKSAALKAQQAQATTQAAATAPAHALETYSWRYKQMGTLIQAKIMVPNQQEAYRLLSIAQNLVDHYDSTFSVHHDSPLNNVNVHAGKPVAVPEEVAQLTQRSIDYARQSDGIFQPMIGPLVNVWKIGFGGEHVPSDAQIKHALKLIDHKHVKIQHKGNEWTIQIKPGQSIDLGGIAKGYIGTEMAEKLKAAGLKHGFLDLGGNIVVIGDKPNGSPWHVGLQMPNKERGDFFAIANVKDTSVITSGAYERFFEENGKRYSHILSAKTGRPVKTDVASVTIISDDGTYADAWCTALFAMGWDKAKAYLEKHPDVKAVMLKSDLENLIVTKAAKPLIDVTDKKLRVHVIE